MSGPPDSSLDDPPKAKTKPSPCVTANLTRLQAESLERYLAHLGTKRWASVVKELRAALERNANGKTYPWQKKPSGR